MFDLNAYLAERQAAVAQRLLEWLPPADQRPVVLSQAMRHAVITGGKRLRPILCLAAAEAAGGTSDAAWHPAIAVELLHAYTLVHDDLPCMDNDTVRRGQPTVWAKYGESTAVLAGDALQSLAFELLARTPASDPSVPGLLVRELAVAAGTAGIIGGQIEDLACGGTADAGTVAYVHQHKTADLFRAAARMGAIAVGAGAGTGLTERLGDFGSHLGVAFQIIDDILDAPHGKPGKPNELSCLHTLTPDQARAQAARLTAAACACLRDLPGPVEPLDALARDMLGRLY
jgi:geranylgeranyl pyrophosphate synthase